MALQANEAEGLAMTLERSPPLLDFSRGFTGRLLVAMPHLADTPFEQTVCLVCSYSDEHAFGVVVNKPMKGVSLADVVVDLGVECDELSAKRPLFYGGPVDMQRGAVLHSLDYRQEDTMLITPEVGLTASKTALKALCHTATAPARACLIMGHAGWEGGQLDDEIKRNDWLTLDPKTEIIFNQTSDVWADSLHLLGISDLTQLKGEDRPGARPN